VISSLLGPGDLADDAGTDILEPQICRTLLQVERHHVVADGVGGV
jgi:hypothetical protein